MCQFLNKNVEKCSWFDSLLRHVLSPWELNMPESPEECPYVIQNAAESAKGVSILRISSSRELHHCLNMSNTLRTGMEYKGVCVVSNKSYNHG